MPQSVIVEPDAIVVNQDIEAEINVTSNPSNTQTVTLLQGEEIVTNEMGFKN